VDVDEVDSGPADRDQHFPLARNGIGQLDQLEHLRPAELLDLNRFHRLIPAFRLSLEWADL